MRIMQGTGQRFRQGGRLVYRQRLARQFLRQGAAMNQLQDTEGPAGLLAHFMDLHDIGVLEAGDGLCLTYAQASKRVNRWAGGIAEKAEPGQRVVIAGNNGYEMLLLCLAASRAGAIVAAA